MKIITPYDIDKMIHWYKQNETIRDIAKTLECHEETVRRNLRKLGFQPRWSKKERAKLIIKKYLNDSTVDDLMQEFSLCRQSVLNILRKNQIDIKESRGGKSWGIDALKKLSRSIGKDHHNWKRGKKIDKTGYVLILNPNRTIEKPQYVREHRYVMEQHLGRKLTKTEHVHHINGIRTDNRLENLQIVQNNRHFGEVVCPYCQHQFLVK
jgi:transposase-like protein